jgi:hypothetical protein
VHFSGPPGRVVHLVLFAGARHYRARIHADGRLQRWRSPRLPRSHSLTVQACVLHAGNKCDATPQTAIAAPR